MTYTQLLGRLFAVEAGALIDPNSRTVFEAIHVQGLIDSNSPKEKRLGNWLRSTLKKMPGTHCLPQAKSSLLLLLKIPRFVLFRENGSSAKIFMPNMRYSYGRF